jgi:hypothetical protein
MYKDFDDLRDNCPAEIKAEVAVDFNHDDPERLKEFWPSTEDGEFRLSLVQRVSDFWEREVRAKGGDRVPDDAFAIEIQVDSYHDSEMGYSMYLELHAYCGTEGIGDLAWSVFADDDVEAEFRRVLPGRAADLLGRLFPGSGVTCTVEVTEVEEL